MLQGQSMKEKIIIIGAGLSGLYTAFLLQSRYDVTLLEARERLGGRVFSINGHDLGPSWIWPHHKIALSLIMELKLPMFLQYAEGDALYQTSSPQRFNAPPQEPAARIYGGIATLSTAIAKYLEKTDIRLCQTVTSLLQENSLIQVQTQDKKYTANFVVNTLPPRLACKLSYTPSLDVKTLQLLQNTPTWMGSVVKLVATYDEAFWRKEGLSGFAFCSRPPLSEVHDATTAKEAALFGFANAKSATDLLQEEAINQLAAIFGIQAKQYKNFYAQNWYKEPFTASKEDIAPLTSHPRYGYDLSAMQDKLFFAGTESSFYEGGYIEGALASAQNVAKKFL
jgi:monoamine oxidase